MKKLYQKTVFLAFTLALLQVNVFSQDNVYTQRFLEMYSKIYDYSNGYFSADSVPYHSIETLMCEAPDYGHETTSEAYSYWIWLDIMYGGITHDWAPLSNSWSKMEKYAIPTPNLQPTAADYTKATFAAEYPLPSYYPSPLENSVPVGEDPMSPDLTSTYGANIYGMHWLFDCDNFYGYGNKGDSVSTPSYINTFQRGEQESVWETVTHPSWEDFSWGSRDGTGFLTLFIDEGGNTPSAQWRYTNAPDADARVVQAMYWAIQFAKEQEVSPSSILPLAETSKMGDFLRLAMCDKYFKPLGVQNKMGAGGTGYESVHYLLSWYYAWGGPLQSQGWGWRIGCSHSHFGYQNPVTAYALSQVPELQPISQNGVHDWGVSLNRQLEFYTWLQSAEGAIAGGVTNSYNGDYSPYPSGTATFYEMAYDDHPVYHDPGSNQWFGMQAWSMERIAELYYISNDERAEALLEKWVPWAINEVQLYNDGTFEIPDSLVWSGQPNTWDPENPTENTNLHVQVLSYGKDLGIAACLAKTLIYYAAGTEQYATLDTAAKGMAKEILDRMWDKYYEPTGAGVAVVESRKDYHRFFDQEIYIPDGWLGFMGNGDTIKSGVKFIDIRSKYRDDPDFQALQNAYNSGQPFQKKYHRFWAQADIALANAEYGRFFGDEEPIDTVWVTGIIIDPDTLTLEAGESETISAKVTPFNATNKEITWTSGSTAIATVDEDGLVTAVAEGTTFVTATSVDGGFSAQCAITVTPYIPPEEYILSVTIIGEGSVSLSPEGGLYEEGTEVTLIATAASGFFFDNWSGDITGKDNPATIIMNDNASVTARFTEGTGFCDDPVSISLPFSKDGTGEFCWVISESIGYINSWNLEKLEINGEDYTNVYVSNFPDPVDGKYYIYYKGNNAWSHVEITLLKNASKVPTAEHTIIKEAEIIACPNPFSQYINLVINNPESIKTIQVFDQSGKILESYTKSDIKGDMKVATGLKPGLYFIRINSSTGETVLKVTKK
jgi:uncharacterized protein YjdB